LPGSQLDLRFVNEADFKNYIGKPFEFVVELDRTRRELIVSRRKVLDAERAQKRQELLDTLQEGMVLDGVVSNFARAKGDKTRAFGAFINLGGIDGLLHVEEMAWHKVDPTKILKEGQTVRVQVIKFDKDKKKISLSLKSLMPNPWDNIQEKFPVGLNVKGHVVSVIDRGAFIQIDEGIDAFLPASEYSWNDSEYTFRKEMKKNTDVTVQIIAVDPVSKKITVSLKRTLPNPWDDVYKKYAPGAKVKGTVQNLTPFGAFIKLPEGIEGLVHISDFSWTKKVNHPADVLKKGDEVEVVVLEVSPQREQISLSIKHMQTDPYKKYKRGNIVKGKVVRVTDFGYFIEIAPGIEALVKHSEASAVKNEQKQEGNIFKEGDEIEAKIIKFDAKTKKIEASVKKLELDQERELVKKYANQEQHPTLGDLLNEEEEDEEETEGAVAVDEAVIESAEKLAEPETETPVNDDSKLISPPPADEPSSTESEKKDEDLNKE
jgi:small subunit ribosomal protein S1